MIFEGTKKSIFFGLGLTRAGPIYPDSIYKCRNDSDYITVEWDACGTVNHTR